MISRVKRFLKSRSLITLLAVVLALGSLAFLFSSPTKASGIEYWFSYYTDNTYETQVG